MHCMHNSLPTRVQSLTRSLTLLVFSVHVYTCRYIFRINNQRCICIMIRQLDSAHKMALIEWLRTSQFLFLFSLGWQFWPQQHFLLRLLCMVRNADRFVWLIIDSTWLFRALRRLIPTRYVPRVLKSHATTVVASSVHRQTDYVHSWIRQMRWYGSNGTG